MTPPPERDLADHRGRLFGLAYRLLGSVAEAEDVVQDVAEVWVRTDRSTIDDPEAWLVTVATRRCLDRLRSARQRREAYVGPWLPEPVVADPTASASPDPADEVALADDVSFALLVVLDQLQPSERVAFVLHDVFGEPYERIGAMVERSPEATRQLASRARRRVRDASPAPRTDLATGQAVTAAFLEASRTGQVDDLVAALAPDAVLTSDGGGAVTAALRPIEGADRIGRFLVGVLGRADGDVAAEPVVVNGEPGARVLVGGYLVAVAAFGIVDGRVATIHLVLNPAKLAHLV